MTTLIAACGLDCTQCEAYQATQSNDRPDRRKRPMRRLHDCRSQSDPLQRVRDPFMRHPAWLRQLFGLPGLCV